MHRLILLWTCTLPLAVLAFQLGMRFWLLQAGEPVVGMVTVAQDSCVTRHRANCFLGRAVVDPRMESHRFKSTRLPGGRFYRVGEELPMRVHPAQRLYLAQVYDPLSWLLGPVRTAACLLLLLFAAAMPAGRRALWVLPTCLVLFLSLG
ncbi:hypothetical protein [Nevskia sp.]|uniref:hypothetical protein n=1 Tax=Nevskia sp. TaxID=1929292 RepID=UPI0025D8C9A5|nr:hypothetical protein [Nevskia sp.]